MVANTNKDPRKQFAAMRTASMNMGTVLGIYYVLKFCLFPLSFRNGFVGMLFIVLTMFVPVVAHRLMKRHRRSSPDNGVMSFSQAWAFALRMFFFASLLAAVAHFVYFSYIDNGMLLQAITDNLDQMAALQVEGATNQATWQKQLDMFREAFDSLAALTPIQITMELFVNNLFWGCIMALPIALLNANKSVMKKNNNQ